MLFKDGLTPSTRTNTRIISEGVRAHADAFQGGSQPTQPTHFSLSVLQGASLGNLNFFFFYFFLGGGG